MPVFQELQEHLCRQENIGQGAMAVGGKGNLEAFTECVEVMTRGCAEETLTEEHGAEARWKFDVSPAIFFLHIEETPIEGGVVRDQQRVLYKSQDFWEDGHDCWSITERFVGNVMDPFGIGGNRTFRVYQ